jgi:hypothetical protein
MFALFGWLGSSLLITANAQIKATTPEVNDVINKADWCPGWQANSGKAMN